MSRLARRIASIFLSICVGVSSASDPVSGYWHRRFNADAIEVKQVKGLSQHVQNGQLHLHLREFLELMLNNSPDIQLARLEAYTAETQITAARAPFDPALVLGFTAQRSISPLFIQLRVLRWHNEYRKRIEQRRLEHGIRWHRHEHPNHSAADHQQPVSKRQRCLHSDAANGPDSWHKLLFLPQLWR